MYLDTQGPATRVDDSRVGVSQPADVLRGSLRLRQTPLCPGLLLILSSRSREVGQRPGAQTPSIPIAQESFLGQIY